MNTITIVFSAHKNNHSCSSNNLYKIFNDIQPDVLFEEISYELYITRYLKQGNEILEIQAIRKYLESNILKQVIVDTIEKNNKVLEQYERLMETMYKSNSKIRDILYIMQTEEAEKGFEYINSSKNDENLKIIENVIVNSNDENIISNFNEWKKYNEKRDINMINNIYNYCQHNIFNNAIFLVGSGHRDSIIKIIERYETRNINWNTNYFIKEKT